VRVIIPNINGAIAMLMPQRPIVYPVVRRQLPTQTVPFRF